MGSLSKKTETKRNKRDSKIAKARTKNEAKKVRDNKNKEGVIIVK